MRSMTTSMSCFSAFFSFGTSPGVDRAAVDAESARSPAPASARRARRTRPCDRGRPAPGTINRVSAGRASVASTIWLTLCACSARPWFGQYGRAGAREQEAQVVVDLGDRADGRARVVRGRLLLDRDRRRQALDDVDVGLVHQLQELARVRRQALDVAALALRRRACRTARLDLPDPDRPGDDDEPVPRDVEVDVLEVVRACAAHPDQRRADVALAPFASLARASEGDIG
jgi:hypothetical protein